MADAFPMSKVNMSMDVNMNQSGDALLSNQEGIEDNDISECKDKNREPTILSKPKRPIKSVTIDEPDGIGRDVSEKAVRKFITENIKHRECKKYIQDAKNNDGRCCCGRAEQWHTVKKLTLDGPISTAGWTSSTCTEQVQANSFGTIKFCGFGSENNNFSPYIRIDHDTDKANLDNMWTLMNDYWHVPPPRLIISVTGGAKRFHLQHRLQQHFKRGLVNAATTTGAWIVTGGTNAGVMEFVGEAVKEYAVTQGVTEQPIVALGIATWGIVDNKEPLVGLTRYGQFPTHYNVDDLTYKEKQGTAPLDPNHSHFILVDDGTEGKFGKEIDFRAAFEQYLSKQMETGVAKNQSVNIPVVLLVLEGGENTLKTATTAVASGTPVVVIKGSGRAADYIVKAMTDTKPKDEEGTEFPEHFKKEYIKNAKTMFDWSREKDEKELENKLEACVKDLEDLLHHRTMITVFTIDGNESTHELDQAILDALLKAKKSDLDTQLYLAVTWNRCDAVRDKILTVENRRQFQKKKHILNDAMFTALVHGRADFVQLFIDNGVELDKFLTVQRLRDLYQDGVESENNCGCSNLITLLLPDVKVPELLKLVGNFISKLCGGQQDKLYQDMDVENETDKTSERGVIPARELFYWSVLMNQRELALMFWKSGKDHIGGALMASVLLKSLASKAEKELKIDLRDDLRDHALIFENRAIGVLNECYTKDKEWSHQLLVRELKQWGGVTLFSLSDSAEQMDFIGQSCCQTKLNQIWKGKMALYTPAWKIRASIFMPFLLFHVKFHDGPVGRSDDEAAMGILPEAPSKKQDEKYIPSKKAKKKKNSSEHLQKVICCGDKPDSINFRMAMLYYYMSPVTKFYFHTLSYLIYLVLFSYVVLVSLKPHGSPDWISPVEYIVWVWYSTLVLEEIRQVFATDPKSLWHKMLSYASSLWNKFDIAVHSLFLISIGLRLGLCSNNFVWARMCYCVTLILYYLRFLQLFFVAKNLGPKVIMIKQMLTDLMFFLTILVVFMLAYGVASQALRYPNQQLDWALLKNVIYQPYWNIYGELFLEDIEGEAIGCSFNQSEIDSGIQRCPEENALAVLLFAIYMILTNVLLLNLLIAMFSYTFERVQDQSEKVWRYYRYSIIYEYYDRPTLAPPLIVFNHMFRILNWLRRKCKKEEKKNHVFKVKLGKEANYKLTAFERVGMEKYLHIKRKEIHDQIDTKVHTTGEKIEKVIEALEAIKEQIVPGVSGEAIEYKSKSEAVLDSVQADLTSVHRRISSLEDRLSTILRLLEGGSNRAVHAVNDSSPRD